MAPQSSGLKTFSELGCLSKETIEVLTVLGFHTTTPVQEATIPLFCGHKDVAVDACTGSGKTLAFVVPVIERLRCLEEPLKPHQVGAIIISPTRELAKQILGVAGPFIASVRLLTSMLLVGGTDPAQDVAAFKARGAHILVGTPGRIEDILKRCSSVDLRRLEVLVLDEADRLLDMGFKSQLDAVMARLPKQRRTGLFSATQTEAVQELARAGLRNPVRVNVAVSVATAAVPPPTGQSEQQPQTREGRKRKANGEETVNAVTAASAAVAVAEQKTPNSLSIQYVICEADEKIPQLVHFLRLYGPSCKVIVYAMTCAAVDHLAVVLPRLPHLRGVRLGALHGRMKQAAREKELETFRQLPAGALLCTDLAARGLDIPDVHWIVQLDPPQDPAAFVHRVGRTARMGRRGSALVYLQPHEEAYVEFLRLRKIPITEGSHLLPADIPIKGGDTAICRTGSQAPRIHNNKKQRKEQNQKQQQQEEEEEEKEQGASGTAVSSSVPEILAALRRAAERDREVMERAIRAFVTYVRGFKEHHCKFIFRVQDLNIGRLARGLGLLRLPKMPDLKKQLGLEHFSPSLVDPTTVPYKDKAREKQRLKALQQRQAADKGHKGEASGGGTAGPAKRKSAASDAAAAPDSRLTAAKRRQLQQIDETANLNAEYRLLKKLKKGRITNHQYDVATGLSSDSDVGEEPNENPRPADAVAAAAGISPSQRGGTGVQRQRDTAGEGDNGDDEDIVGEAADGDEGEAGGGGGGVMQQGKQPGDGKAGAATARRGSKGTRGLTARGQQPRGVVGTYSVLQSYIDKRAKKKKRKKKGKV